MLLPYQPTTQFQVGKLLNVEMDPTDGQSLLGRKQDGTGTKYSP